MPLVRWRFDDPVALSGYEFEINPSAGGSPSYQRNFTYAETSAPDGKSLVFEGRQPAQHIEFSGRLLSESQFNAFVTWWEKQYQIEITDDLGRTFSVIIESFNPTRVRRRSNQWVHDYQVRAVIIDWPDPDES